ncbi:MAG: hypothetical protein U1E56_04940 [Bauldia sp.]
MIEGLLLLAAGVLLVAAFIYLNFVWQKRFVDERGVLLAAPGTWRVLGLVEALLFIVGIIFTTAGLVLLGLLEPTG